VTDAVTVGLQAQSLSVAGTDIRSIGLSSAYSFGSGFAELGVANVDVGSSSSTLATASVGLRF
jgi:hypothetical protein